MKSILNGFKIYRRKKDGKYGNGRIRILKSGWITLPNPFIDKYEVEKAPSCTVYFDKKGKVAFRFYFNEEGLQRVRMRGGKWSCGMCIRGLTRQLDFIPGLYEPIKSERQEDGSVVVVLKKMEE